MSLQLYSHEASTWLLGYFLNNPTMLLNGTYNLTGEDFSENLFHRILFFAIRNLLNKGATEIDEIALDSFLSNYEEYYDEFKDNNGLDVIPNIKELSKEGTVDYYYDIVKKYSLLRYYESKGFDILPFFDKAKNEIEQRKNLGKYSREEIIEYYEKINIDAKKQFIGNNDIEHKKVGDGFKSVKEEFMKEPMFGATTCSEYLNTATRGLIKGQLSILSMKSGSGKSTIGINNLIKICCKEIYSIEQGKYISNPNYQENEGGLYIQYEMNNEYECDPKFIASLSKVDTEHILNGTYEKGEEERVDYAIKILEDSNIYMVMMPSFTLSSIENCVQEYVVSHKIGYLVFDYISEQASVNSEIARNNGVATRADMVLATMSSKLKDIAQKYNIAVLTFTQTNANAETQEILDAGCIAGSRAVQNKADVGGIMYPIRPKEYKIMEEYLGAYDRNGFHKVKPNRIIHLYKVRFGSEEQGIKIWCHVNLGTGDVTDCWVTDKNDKHYKMERIIL